MESYGRTMTDDSVIRLYKHNQIDSVLIMLVNDCILISIITHPASSFFELSNDSFHISLQLQAC